MRSDWIESELTDFLECIIDHRGRTPKKLGGDFSVSGIPVISAKNVRESRLKRTEDQRYVEPEMWNRWMPKKLQAGDVLLTSEAPLGEVAYLADEQDLCLGQRLFALRADSQKLYGRFLYYALRSPTLRNRLRARASGTTAQGIRQAELRKVPVLVPSLAEQLRILSVLGSFDDKIENNRRIAKTLEEIAAVLFKARFVDFVDHDDLVESKIGLIPRGWEAAPLSEVSRVLTRGRGPAYIDDGGVLVLNQRCIRDGRVSFDSVRRNDEERRSSADRRVELGDVLINSTGVGTLGRVAQIRWLPEAATIDSHVTMIRADGSRAEQDYLAMALLLRQRDLERLGHGSTGQTELTRSRLAEFTIPIPRMDAQRAFTDTYRPIRHAIAALEREAVTLTVLRDSLLPKLISGQIRPHANAQEGASR